MMAFFKRVEAFGEGFESNLHRFGSVLNGFGIVVGGLNGKHLGNN